MSELISTNPAQGFNTIDSITISSETVVRAAVARANEAFPAWSTLTPNKRAAYLQKLKDVFDARTEDIAVFQSSEMGKPITESRAEMKKVSDTLAWHIENAPGILEPATLDTFDAYETVLYREPYGVAAVLAPWNFPTSQFLTATTMLLLAGNTVVLKHSEECALTSKYLTELFSEADFPEGVFQCVFGDGQVGELLLDQNIHFVAFTGSTKVGERVYQKAAEKFIPALLEMGGSSPGIVFEDADLTDTGTSVFQQRFNNCGQVCFALKRLFVQESVFDSVVSNLQQLAEASIIGNPLDERTTLGPLAAKRQVDLLAEQIEDARSKGATIVTGGKRPKGLDGAFYEPTLITNTTPDMRVIREEVFGPALSIIPFKHEQDAIERANDTEFGLSGFVYSTDIKRAVRVAQALQVGQISINGYPFASNHAPFGGYKKSGIGRTKGVIGYHTMTQEKVIAEPR